MALILKDRVLETSQTSGTGTLTLAGAVIDFQSFSSAIGNGNTTYYTIADDADNQWEVGIGTVGAGTLTRDIVLSSSNSGNLVNFGASIKNVFCDYPASKSVYQDANGLVTVPNLATNSASNLTPVLTYNASNSAQTNGATVAGSYLQNVMQNKSGTAGASTNFAVSNDLGTDSSYYGEFGMNSSVFSSGTPADYFSINNGVYFSGHDGDITLGSGNGYKTYLAWGTTGDKAHVINASGAIGLNTNITGTTNFGTAGYILTSGGSSATPTWTNPTSIVGGAGGSNTQVQYNNSGALAGSANFTFNGTTVTMANDASISGLTVGKGGGAVATNTAFGASALATNTSGSENSAFGQQALLSNTTGINNNAIGRNALALNTTGSNNTASGYHALLYNTTGGSNAAFGTQALTSNTTASYNTAVGYQAGYTNTGAQNTAVGCFALKDNTTGQYNAAFGMQSLQTNTTASNNAGFGYATLISNTTGAFNTALGSQSLYYNTTASNNTAVGYQAGYSNTTGGLTALGYAAAKGNTTGGQNIAIGYNALLVNSTGNYNIAIGDQSLISTTGSQNLGIGPGALYTNSSGGSNVALGYASLYSNTTASNNTAVGYQAGYSNTTGSITALGYQAGYANTTGTGNVFIGAAAGINVSTGTMNTFIGPAIIGATYSSGYFVTTGSKNSIFGNYNGNQGGLDIRTASNYIVLSDGDGNPMAYVQNGGGWYQQNNAINWSITSDVRIKKNVASLESGLNVISALRPVEFDYIANDKHDIGFIAQEYQNVLPSQISEGEDGMLSLNQNLVPYLVKAIQELTAKVTALETQLGK